MKRIGRMGRGQRQQGFTLIELIITTCILAILSSIAIAQMRDYTRRTKISEVVMGLGNCRDMVSENYATFDSAPEPGHWGCEVPALGNYGGRIETSSNGVIRIAVDNLDGLMNGRHIYLVPAKSNGSTPMITPDDLGNGVRSWICGSDWLPVRNALPANCRADTTTFASDEFH